MPRCRCASSSPQAGCCIDHKPTGTSSQKIASNPSATRDMASDRRIQKKTHGPNHDQRKRRYTRGCNPKRHGAKATTTKAVCVLMPFLPKILLLRQLFPDMSTTDAYVGDNFACRMAFFDRRCRQRAFRTYALLVEPASRAPKNLGESKANTNNPMAACAPERNGMHSNNKRPVPACLSASALSMKTFCSCCCCGKSFCCCYCCCRGSSICCCYFSSC